MIVQVFDHKEEIKGAWTYTTQLYKKETIQNYIKSYLKIIQEVLQDNDQRISQIPLIEKTEIEKAQRIWKKIK